MKQFRILGTGLLFAIIAFTACNGGDSVEKKLVKKWKLTEMTALMPDSMKNEYVSKSVLEFKTDGTYSIAGAENMTQNGKYKLADDGKSVTFTFANRDDKIDIIKLTDDELELTSKVDEYTMKAKSMK